MATATTSSEPRTCPVCATAFAPSDRAAFALHVADCTAPALAATGASSSSSSSFTAAIIDGVATATCATPIESCGLCHHVYASGTAEHVVEFHAFECARVNKRKAKGKAAAQRPVAKRPREPSSSASDDTTADAPTVSTAPPLFPAHCALCNSVGRSLLQCSGGCMRAFHAACVDSVMPGNSKVPSVDVTGLSSSPPTWRCAECTRDVHACMRCGFLGLTSNTLMPCSVRDCGYFVHTTCQSADSAASPFVCPRHTCAMCGAVETDMRACTSCTKCFKATHRQCPSAAGSSQAAAADATSPLIICDAHSAANSSSKLASNPEATLALKYRVQQGDIVLVLECANALLPASAKAAAPDASNQWGVVSRAENIDGRDQLLTIKLFSDGSAVSVPNQYVLPLGTANAFASPHVMLRDCIKWHAVTELNIRRSDLDAAAGNDALLTDVRDQILNASCSAFYARAEMLGLSISQLFSAATEGYTFWSTHRTELAAFAGSGAPIYVYLDTRAPGKSAPRSAASVSRSESNGAAPASGNGDDDVDMDGGDDDDTPAPGSGRSGSNGAGTGAKALDGASGVQRSGLTDAPVVDVSTAVIVASMLNDMITNVERVAAAAPVAMKQSSHDSDNDVVMTDCASAPTETKRPLTDPVACVKPDALKVDPTVSVAAAPSPNLKDAALVNGVKVKADVTFALQDATADDVEGRAAKRPKLSVDSIALLKGADPLAGVVAPASPLVVLTAKTAATAPVAVPSTNAFVRTAAPAPSVMTGKHAAPPPRRTRKERMLAEYSPQLLRELERQAAVFLDQEANPPSRRASRKSLSPQHCDAFPAATAPEAFRPPYFRPSVVFSRARGRRLDGLSRILLSQDKRNVKCFIQGTDANRCLHQPRPTAATARPEGTFVTIDLMSVDSFRALDMVIRTRMIAAVEQDDRYLHEMFGAHAERARRVLQDRKRAPVAIEIYYCCYDGSRTKVARHSDDWLCFCANVCHLTAVIPLQAAE